MATASPFNEEDLLCPVCRQAFSFPVTLACQHSFCEACIQSHWEWKGSRLWPLRRHSENTRRPPINLALKIASDTFKAQASLRSVNPDNLCSIHSEELKMFCHKESKPICLICHMSRDHKGHQCDTIPEAAAARKKALSNRYEALREHPHSTENMKGSLEELEAHMQNQAVQTEAQIRDEFEKLHKFLREEEAARLTVLKDEMDRKVQAVRQRLENIKEDVDDISEIIEGTESTLRSDDLSFLKNWQEAIRRICYPIEEVQYPQGALIDTAQYLGSLKYGVWKRLAGEVKSCPIALDPNTAQPNMILSDEVMSVRYGKKQQLPDNPECCSSRLAVLASTDFTLGKHCWDVEVGDSQEWYIGVARESIKRKTAVFLNPAEGFWVTGLSNGETYWAQTSPRTRLALKKRPQRITVELDYEKGKVAFLNAVDGSIIYMFKDKFTERIFPYFSPGIHGDGENALRICPLKVSITLN
ncbi:LOW QUALITY PROTEIN: zinc-binding protein A33-like [Electrophorus electricus]|uniref:LOW QUALITY PROTEIN: zinc-binding protein A33-like n=1 Tax=Electrophorus electricus TaxID=8005 RepID=UPI0015D03A1A|nr:LOW QUALITY PROTEIN: zinc-binding protein A33-like [Electrophorus electricus]